MYAIHRDLSRPSIRMVLVLLAATLAVTGLASTRAVAADGNDAYLEATADGWAYESLFTTGDSVGDYTPPGVLDGLHAYAEDDRVVILANHELTPEEGPVYQLANGTELTGSRVSRFVVDPVSHEVTEAGLLRRPRRVAGG